MTIHSDHPFLPPRDDRDQLRRLRGRMPAPVTVWTAGQDRDDRVGLTVSSILVAGGEPGHVVGLIDGDSDFWDAEPQAWVVNVLGPAHRFLAEGFAGTAPAPGGPFTLGEWTASSWGPVLDGHAGWLGVRLSEPPRPVGWSLLVHGVVESATVGEATAMAHVRGRYRDLDAGPERPRGDDQRPR